MLYDHCMLKNSKNNKSQNISLCYTILIFESKVNEDHNHTNTLYTHKTVRLLVILPQRNIHQI